MEYWTPVTLLVERKRWSFWGKGFYIFFEEFRYKILLSRINSSLFHFSWHEFKFDLHGSFIDDLEERGVCESFALRYLKKCLHILVSTCGSIWNGCFIAATEPWRSAGLSVQRRWFACLQGYKNLRPRYLEHLLWYFAKRHLYFMFRRHNLVCIINIYVKGKDYTKCYSIKCNEITLKFSEFLYKYFWTQVKIQMTWWTTKNYITGWKNWACRCLRAAVLSG